MPTAVEQERLVRMVKESISLMCKSSLTYHVELNIEGLLGITVDKNHIFLVNINESLRTGQCEGVASPVAESSMEAGQNRRSISHEEIIEIKEEEMVPPSGKKRRVRQRSQNSPGTDLEQTASSAMEADYQLYDPAASLPQITSVTSIQNSSTTQSSANGSQVTVSPDVSTENFEQDFHGITVKQELPEQENQDLVEFTFTGETYVGEQPYQTSLPFTASSNTAEIPEQLSTAANAENTSSQGITMVTPAFEVKVEADQPSKDGDGGPINKTAREVVQSPSDKARMESSCPNGTPDVTLTSGTVLSRQGQQQERFESGNPIETEPKVASTKKYTQGDLDAACEAVAKGTSLNAASRNFGIPLSVVWTHTRQVPGVRRWFKKKHNQATRILLQSKRKTRPVPLRKTKDTMSTSRSLAERKVLRKGAVECEAEKSADAHGKKRMRTRKFSEQDTHSACKAVAQGMTVTAAARKFGVCFATVWRRTRQMAGAPTWGRRKTNTGTRRVRELGSKRKLARSGSKKTTYVTSASGTFQQEAERNSGDTKKIRRSLKTVLTRKGQENGDGAWKMVAKETSPPARQISHSTLTNGGKQIRRRVHKARSRKLYSESDMNAACEAVAKGMSVKAAVKHFDVPYTTVWKHTRQLPGVRTYTRRKYNSTKALDTASRGAEVSNRSSRQTKDVTYTAHKPQEVDDQREDRVQSGKHKPGTPKARTYSEGDLDAACQAVAKGMSSSAAARHFGVPYTTLWKHTRHIFDTHSDTVVESMGLPGSSTQRMKVHKRQNQRAKTVNPTAAMHIRSERDTPGHRTKVRTVASKKYSQEDMDAACEAVAKGMAVSAAAQQFGVPTTAVWKVTRQIPGVRTHKRYRIEDVRAACAAVQNGTSVREAAQKYGINCGTLRLKVSKESRRKVDALREEEDQT